MKISFDDGVATHNVKSVSLSIDTVHPTESLQHLLFLFKLRDAHRLIANFNCMLLYCWITQRYSTKCYFEGGGSSLQEVR